MVHKSCGGSWEKWGFIRVVVAYGSWCGSLEMWWLIGDVVAHGRCGGSLEMCWLIGGPQITETAIPVKV